MEEIILTSRKQVKEQLNDSIGENNEILQGSKNFLVNDKEYFNNKVKDLQIKKKSFILQNQCEMRKINLKRSHDEKMNKTINLFSLLKDKILSDLSKFQLELKENFESHIESIKKQLVCKYIVINISVIVCSLLICC